MMKWISLILGFLFRSKPSRALNFKELALEVIDEAMIKSRKPIGLILLGLASIIFICGGIFISLIDATRQFDATGNIEFGATFWSGIVLSAIFLVSYLYAFTRAWPGVKHMKAKIKAEEEKIQAETESIAPNLEEAISLLIMDHIEARKKARERRQEERREERRHAGSYGQTERKTDSSTPPAGFA